MKYLKYYKNKYPILRKIIPKPIRKIAWYLESVRVENKLKTEGNIDFWTKFIHDSSIDDDLRLMIKDYVTHVKTDLQNQKTSASWVQLGARHIEELKTDYDHFKWTIATKYFTVRPNRHHEILNFLTDNIPKRVAESLRLKAEGYKTQAYFSREQSIRFNYLTLLFREYALKLDLGKYLEKLSEPSEGDPLSISVDGKEITQDLINSTIEFSSIIEYPDFAKIKTMAEIGGGYGRTAFVFLKLLPKLTPPILFVL